MNYVFYDTETTGIDHSFDQILQFAGILTDENLQEIDRYEVRCRLDPHVVPSAGALRVTGQTIGMITDPARISHYDMMQELRAKLLSWSPAIFLGWNTIGFDEAMLRQAFYKTLHRPYLTVLDGNERADTMKLVQCLEAFAPDSIVIPTRDDGRPVFKLDQLAPANGFAHANAHDAMADVEATIFIASLLRQNAPNAWEMLRHTASKHRVKADLEAHPVCMYRDNFFGRFYEAAVTRIGTGEAGAEMCLDLRNDPAALIAIDEEALTRWVKRSPKPVRSIRANKAPLISPAPVGLEFAGVAYEVMLERAEYLANNAELRARLLTASTPDPLEEGGEVEERIFEAFPSQQDQALMDQFHAADWPTKAAICDQFTDERYRILAKRIVFIQAPEQLDEAAMATEMTAQSQRLLGLGVEDPNWLTLHSALEEVTDMLANCEPGEIDLLEGHRDYVTAKIAEANAILT